MASSGSSAKTAPKGRATRSRGDASSGGGISATTQWVLVAVALVAIVSTVLFFTRDVRSNLGGHSGAPAAVEIDVASATGF
ncbi:MAG: hypothetical protein AB8G26_03965 [Ilumatobacter sp.]